MENLKKKVGLDANKQQSTVPPYKVPLSEDYYLKKNNTSPQGRKANAAIVMLGMLYCVLS